MTCYEIAKGIMSRIRTSGHHVLHTHRRFLGVEYYDASDDHEYFCLKDEDVELQVTYSEIVSVTIRKPRGIVHFNLRLWLKHLDRITK